MTPTTLLLTDRPLPAQLKTFLKQKVGKWDTVQQEDYSVKDGAVLLMLCPSFYHNKYLSTEQVWKKHLVQYAPTSIMLTIGLQTAIGPNHLDLLALPNDWADFMAKAQPAANEYPITLSGGVDTADKLRRFFAGHGNDSVSEVLARIRRTLRVAAGELDQPGANVSEIQRELLQPARLSVSWREWQSRWQHYEPLLRGLPISKQLRSAVSRLLVLTPWMESDCKDAGPLQSGKALSIIDGVKRELNDLESRYVQ